MCILLELCGVWGTGSVIKLRFLSPHNLLLYLTTIGPYASSESIHLVDQLQTWEQSL